MKERKKQLKKEGKPTNVEEDDPELVSEMWEKPRSLLCLSAPVAGLESKADTYVLETFCFNLKYLNVYPCTCF